MTELQEVSIMEEKEPQDAMLGNGRIDNVEGVKMPQYLITLAVTMLVFCGGTVIGWTSPALPYIQTAENATFTISAEEGSWIGSLLAIGAFIGALPAGSLADMFGRKMVILSLAFPFLISWAIVFAGKSASLLYVARLLGGIALGASCAVVPMYIAEIAEGSVRGKLCSSFQLMLVVGILYTYIMGAICSYTVLSIVCGIIPLIFLLVFFKAPESPIYLLKKDKRHGAEMALKTLRGSAYNTYKELHSLENELTSNSGTKVSFLRAVSRKESIRALVISLGLMTFQQFSGINIVIFYSGQIFKDAGSTLNPEIATIIVGIAQVAATLLSAILVDKAGRKILLQISAALMAVCLGILGYYFHLKERGDDVSNIGTVPLFSMVTYIIIFSLGFGPIPWMMAGEVLPSDIKGIGTGIAVALNWSLAFAVTKSFQTLLDNLGTAKTYWCFGIICVVGLAFVTLLVIETKGKSLVEIQNELSGKSKNTTRE